MNLLASPHSRYALVAGLTLAATLAGGLAVTPLTVLAQDATASEYLVPGDGRVVIGFAMPDARPRLSFDRTGIIKEVYVEKGQQVAQNDRLVKLDDAEEQEQAKILETEAAAAKARILASQKELAQAQVELRRKERIAASNPGVINTEELERAKLEAELGEVRVQIAEAELAKVEAQQRAQQTRIDRMTLRSTINGTIEDVSYEEGEAFVDIEKPVVFLVSNNPVKVEVKSLDRDVVRQLQVGDELPVRFRAEEAWRPAKVTFIASLGDPRSNTSQIELEMPNPEGRATGQTVEVLIPRR